MAKVKELTLEISDLNSEGQGVARLGRDVYFVPGALPGERIRGRLEERRRKVWYVRLLEIETPSENRVEPACAHYSRCGGCDIQHLNYPAQVEVKQRRVEREFQRQGLTVSNWAEPITAAPWHYRRRARLGVRFSKKADRLYLGFRESGSEHLTDIQSCPVMLEQGLYDWQAWQAQLNQLSGKDRITQIETLSADNGTALILRVLKPLIASDVALLRDFMQEMASSSADQLWVRESKDAPLKLLWPDSAQALQQTVSGHSLPVKPDDFLQVNAEVNRLMVVQALEWLGVEAGECVWDLFAGLGNFSIPLTDKAKTVVAVEGQQGMVDSLASYAENMALSLHSVRADLFSNTILQSLLDQSLPKPDKILLDPPRAGAFEIATALAQSPVNHLVYVSCDPATLARDLRVLTESGYDIIKAGIMDMFPQTHHVETMVCLTFKGKKDGKSSRRSPALA